ncbi:MAG: nitrous oxide reductase accessory protein NosL [Gemmataceae bacterium]
MRLRLLTTLVTTAAAGCGADGPPPVRYGHESCSRCRMIVNDKRFAAAAATVAGDALKFDDVCCLVAHLVDHPGDVRQAWVRGYEADAWLDARAAHYAYGPKLQTPMGSGLAAVATPEEAAALAREWGGRALRFDDLSAFLAESR